MQSLIIPPKEHIPHIHKTNGIWQVSYYRHWDSKRNYLYPNYKSLVVAAIKHCTKLSYASPEAL